MDQYPIVLGSSTEQKGGPGPLCMWFLLLEHVPNFSSQIQKRFPNYSFIISSTEYVTNCG